MIIFFTFDALLVLGFVILFGYLIANGVSETISMIITNYLPIMKTGFIIVTVLAIILGIISGYIMWGSATEEKGKKYNFAYSIAPAIFYGIVVPPVILFTLNETFGFINNFAGKGGIFYLIFFGLIFIILYFIAVTIELLVGLGIPVLIASVLTAHSSFWAQAVLILIGFGIGALYYYILKDSNIFPFVTVYTS